MSARPPCRLPRIGRAGAAWGTQVASAADADTHTQELHGARDLAQRLSPGSQSRFGKLEESANALDPARDKATAPLATLADALLLGRLAAPRDRADIAVNRRNVRRSCLTSFASRESSLPET